MIEETLHAANWWVEKIISYKINVEAPSWQSHFETVLTELLRAKYHNHWYKNDPTRGSGYRAISNEYSLDPILDKAAKAVSHSLPKNLARSVLTSDDRWLVMFVNPGEVTIRDKQFREIAIYDKENHIYNKSIKKSTAKWFLNNNSNKKNANNSNKNKIGSSAYSKSDDETLATLDESKSDLDTNTATKSDPEDGTDKTTEIKDYRKIFLQNIHDIARRTKEKELQQHVEAYKEELNRKQVASYWNMSNHHKSPSKSSTTTTATSESSTSSPSKTITKDPPSGSNTPRSPSSPQQHQEQQHDHQDHENEDGEITIGLGLGNDDGPNLKTNHQILSVLNTLNLPPKLHQNGFNSYNHGNYGNLNGLRIDIEHSNYGKHLKQILNSCKIHSRLMNNDKNLNINDNHKDNKHRNSYKNGTILDHMNNNSNNPGKHEENNQYDQDYVLDTNDEYPVLFPLSYASPTPSIDSTDCNHPITPLSHCGDDRNIDNMDNIDINYDNSDDIDIVNAEPSISKPSKSQAIAKKTNHSIQRTKPKDFELHIDESSDEDEDDDVHQQLMFKKYENTVQSTSHQYHEEDQDSEIIINNASSPIYDSASPQIPINDGNASPSSHGSKLLLIPDLDLDQEDLKY